MEKDKEIAELYERAIEQTEALRKAQQQERLRSIQKQRLNLTKEEVSSLPDETVMYKSVGKAYFAWPKSEIVSGIESKIKANDAEIDNLKKQQEAIALKVKDTESQFKDLKLAA
mmetsp:Transcript_29010/g.53310  ORF Transcript_29010/g.53310 Transcript_29010/m.53310 type:complete len:114 (-) Transcript_29010:1212-1553(-)|eukprot:CAMPEP_0175046556 /NCGR_PEP_ID=MMETSP0052_2-20121109/5096_1 /TAXON_ID=51329 ORGANISM="Polytomella parva, Strain SAG 63-3" /NCGR_SAMPLE_ID=MMETSP0052_2 /ASSEMBLY_ACC=CAM_ASM_000194 /LENGTH=113 /DNA_ID=CAMNT_0016310315 /DNA_START=34 /DNA_END=375 /DNA_ORIENTATION=-